MQHFPAKGGHEVVIFQWSTAEGYCADCGLPAAFYWGPKHTEETRVCAICAANAAVDGERIHRIDGYTNYN